MALRAYRQEKQRPETVGRPGTTQARMDTERAAPWSVSESGEMAK
jgi:hypothetical protein